MTSLKSTKQHFDVSYQVREHLLNPDSLHDQNTTLPRQMLWYFPYPTILWMIFSFPAFWCFLIIWFTSSVRHSIFAQSRKFSNGPKCGNITRTLQKLSGIWDGFLLSNMTLGYMPSPNTAKAKQSAHSWTDNTCSCTSTNPWRPSLESWIYCWLGSHLCTR